MNDPVPQIESRQISFDEEVVPHTRHPSDENEKERTSSVKLLNGRDKSNNSSFRASKYFNP
jgi:hypothetical protein